MDFFTFMPDSALMSVLCERSLCLSLFFDFDFLTGVDASSWLFLSFRFDFDFLGLTFSCWISSGVDEVGETGRESRLTSEGFKGDFREGLRTTGFGRGIGVVDMEALIDANGLSSRLPGDSVCFVFNRFSCWLLGDSFDSDELCFDFFFSDPSPCFLFSEPFFESDFEDLCGFEAAGFDRTGGASLISTSESDATDSGRLNCVGAWVSSSELLSSEAEPSFAVSSLPNPIGKNRIFNPLGCCRTGFGAGMVAFEDAAFAPGCLAIGPRCNT